MLNTWLPLPIWLRFLAKSVSFGLSRLRWRAQSSSRSSLSGRLRSFISSVTHTPSRKYALWSSFGHASLGNSKPAVSQRSSNRRSSSCCWMRCVVVMVFFLFLLIDVIFGLASVLPCVLHRAKAGQWRASRRDHVPDILVLLGRNHSVQAACFYPYELRGCATSCPMQSSATRLTSSAMRFRKSSVCKVIASPELVSFVIQIAMLGILRHRTAMVSRAIPVPPPLVFARSDFSDGNSPNFSRPATRQVPSNVIPSIAVIFTKKISSAVYFRRPSIVGRTRPCLCTFCLGHRFRARSPFGSCRRRIRQSYR